MTPGNKEELQIVRFTGVLGIGKDYKLEGVGRGTHVLGIRKDYKLACTKVTKSWDHHLDSWGKGKGLQIDMACTMVTESWGHHLDTWRKGKGITNDMACTRVTESWDRRG